jgi:hypothetical protein
MRGSSALPQPARIKVGTALRAVRLCDSPPNVGQRALIPCSPLRQEREDGGPKCSEEIARNSGFVGVAQCPELNLQCASHAPLDA